MKRKVLAIYPSACAYKLDLDINNNCNCSYCITIGPFGRISDFYPSERAAWKDAWIKTQKEIEGKLSE